MRNPTTAEAATIPCYGRQGELCSKPPLKGKVSRSDGGVSQKIS